MHAVENMVSYNGARTWHGLEVLKAGTAATSAEVLRDARLDWTVSKRPLALADGGLVVPEHVAVVRDSDAKVLGVVKRTYEPVQNADALAVLDPIVSTGDARYETAGSLWGGALVFALVRLDVPREVVPGDRVEAYALVSNGHDGGRGVAITLTDVRVVCWNTLSRAERGGKRLLTLRHTRGVRAGLDKAGELLVALRERAVAAGEQYRAMAARQMLAAEIRDYLVTVVPDPTDPEMKRARQDRERTRDEIMALIESGKGADIPGVRGTLWGCLNAVTEYVDHHRHAGSDPEARAQAIAFGAGAELKATALDAALARL